MTEVDIKLVPITGKSHFLELDKFSEANWGEHSDGGDPQTDFFDTPKWAVIATLNDRTVGELFIFDRNSNLENTSIHFAGIGGVVTHQDFRHRGIATKMLTFAINFLKSVGFDFALLCTDISNLGPLYAQVGFTPLPSHYSFTDKNGQNKIETGAMIAPLANSELTDQLISSSDTFYVGVSNF